MVLVEPTTGAVQDRRQVEDLCATRRRAITDRTARTISGTVIGHGLVRVLVHVLVPGAPRNVIA
jgi:hypothetical protein